MAAIQTKWKMGKKLTLLLDSIGSEDRRSSREAFRALCNREHRDKHFRVEALFPESSEGKQRISASCTQNISHRAHDIVTQFQFV